MTTYLINLKNRPDRLATALEQCQNVGITPTVFEAINGKLHTLPKGWRDGAGAYGCSLSHRAVLTKCIEDKAETALILEDDVTFCPDFVSQYQQLILNLPSNWDAFMLGGEHIRPPQPINEHFVRGVRVARTHAYLIRQHYMPVLFDLWNKNMGHIDHIWREHMTDTGVNVYCPVKWLCGQGAGKSDINGRTWKERYWYTPKPKVIVRRVG